MVVEVMVLSSSKRVMNIASRLVFAASHQLNFLYQIMLLIAYTHIDRFGSGTGNYPLIAGRPKEEPAFKHRFASEIIPPFQYHKITECGQYQPGIKHRTTVPPHP